MERFQLTDSDKNLIEIALEVIHKNFDNKFYNHTVGCALLCKKLAKIKDYKSMYEEMEKWLDEVIFKYSLPLGNYLYKNNIFLNLTAYTHDAEMPKEHGFECMIHHLGSNEFDDVRNEKRFKTFIEKAKERYSIEIMGK